MTDVPQATASPSLQQTPLSHRMYQYPDCTQSLMLTAVDSLCERRHYTGDYVKDNKGINQSLKYKHFKEIATAVVER